MFSSETVKAAALIAVVLAIFGGGFKAGWDWEATVLWKERAANAQALAKAAAQAAAEQKSLDDAALDDASREAAAQSARVAQLSRNLEAARHAPVKTITRSCVPLGLVRVLDGAAFGRDPASLALPAGKSLDACASLGWRDLVGVIVGNYGTARDNAGQLDALIQAWRRQDEIHRKETSR